MTKSQDDLEFIKRVLDFTLVKVHTKRDGDSEFSPIMKLGEVKDNRIKSSSSMDSIYQQPEENKARRSFGKALIDGIQAFGSILISPMNLKDGFFPTHQTAPKPILKQPSNRKHTPGSAVSISV